MTVKTQRISESRFAAKGSFSKEFVKIVRTFSKFFWDLDQKCWTLPIEHEAQFISLLESNGFNHQKEVFYQNKQEFRNSVLIKFNNDDRNLNDFTQEMFNSDTELQAYIFISYYTKSFSNLILDMYCLKGDCSFDEAFYCFTFKGKLGTLVNFFKQNFFNVYFEYLNHISYPGLLDAQMMALKEKKNKKQKTF